MVAHGRYLKRLLGPETAVIFAGPCIAKKNEAESSEGAVDVGWGTDSVTFRKLRKRLVRQTQEAIRAYGMLSADGTGSGRRR